MAGRIYWSIEARSHERRAGKGKLWLQKSMNSKKKLNAYNNHEGENKVVDCSSEPDFIVGKN